MKRLAIFFLFFLLPIVCLAEEKVYTNTDLKPEPPIYNKSTLPSGPQQQREDSSNSKERIISRGIFEQRDPVVQPKYETRQQPQQSPNNQNHTSDTNQTPQAFTPVNPFPAPPQGKIEQLLAEACARVTLLMLIIVGIPFLIWLICLIDILRHEFTGNNKIIWFLVVFFLPVIGSILYFFIGTDQKIKPEDDEEPITRLI